MRVKEDTELREGVTELTYKKARYKLNASRAGRIVIVAFNLALLGGCGLAQRHRQNAAGLAGLGDQPDKVLYEKATNEIQHGRYDVGRLTLQTLMNTYPDSEYLSKAKLAIADSYYKEGGISGLTQAEVEYKDYITFFPTAPEAPEAQFRIGMAHFHLMGKPDRDRQEALLAEVELKEFLLKYPDSPLMPRAKARLREVQEVLGQSDYKIAHFYYMKGALPAARSRFEEIVDHYPSFSEADAALWYLGQSWERMKQPTKAAPYYSQLVANYPLSSYLDNAKNRLVAMRQPVPKSSKAVLARARADALRPHKPNLLARLGETMSSGPDYRATRRGPALLSRPAPTETKASKASAPVPAGNTIAVQPVPDTALSPGKQDDPKADEKPAAKTSTASNPQDHAQENARTEDTPQDAKREDSGSKSGSSQDVPAPRKKKGKLHFLKKVVP